MIQLDQLSVVYNSGALVALNAVDIEFKPTEFTVLLGASGAGKTTLLRSINFLSRPSSGEVRVAGKRIDGARALQQHRRNTAMIFQQHQLIKRQSVLNNVLAGRLGYYSSLRSLFPMRQSDRRLALHCLERVGLLERALDRVDHLSGGQQQRVGIARALAQQPKVILADEPVASLDPASVMQVMSLLKGICHEDGITMIVSLHQLEIAKAYAQRIVALAKGRVIFDGGVDELGDRLVSEIYPRRIVVEYFGEFD